MRYILNSQAIQYCERCNAVLPSVEYLDFVATKTGHVSRVRKNSLLCQDCQRRMGAAVTAE